MQLPASFLASLEGVKGFDKAAFEKAHASGEPVTSVRLNPSKPVTRLAGKTINELTKIPWSDYGYYLDKRPSFTFDPLFHAGCYYVQEASSMFLEQAFKQLISLSQPVKVLDLCAAPGGKSTHIQSLISAGSLLVSNEVIRSRVPVLKDNIIKWGCENVVVTHNDPEDFARLGNYFDVIVVDAPCSGSGLFRRDEDAIKEWSEQHVQFCSQRQQRILASVWPALKKEGLLVYSTCSYSPEEDEAITSWMQDDFRADICHLSSGSFPGIIESGGGYRFWPDQVKGEGFFLACFRKKEEEARSFLKARHQPERAGKKEMELIGKWVNPEGKYFIKHVNRVYAWPGELSGDFSFLLEQLRVIYSGVLAGELVRDKLVPDHALAMSRLVKDTIIRTAWELPHAISYLQRKETGLQPADKGWQLISFGGHALGWVNVLENRVNNYYPRELRIIKDIFPPEKK